MYSWEEFTIGQKLAWIFSTVSNGLWLFVFIPQLYKNYKTQKSVALSLSLLFCLILGDIFSIISAYIKELNIVIIYAALYHIILDIVIISQILYYRRKAILKSDDDLDNTEDSPLLENEDNIEFLDYPYFYLSFWEFILVIGSLLLIFLSTLFVLIIQAYDTKLIIADIIAWSATSIFMLARLPQIWLNFRRKSTKGLSLLSFIIINIANLFFLLSVLIIMYDLDENNYIDYIKSNIQWIVGSSSTTLFDCIIFYQFYKYKSRNIFESEIE
jgi:uncharacterized protein with PQ loop repeat